MRVAVPRFLRRGCGLALLLSALALPARAEPTPPLPALPHGTLVEYQANNADANLVVILSGDGGWADLDRSLGERLSERGYSVLGFDCLKYFDGTHTPDQTARDLNAALQHYLAAWHKKRVVLIGFSFGGNVEPFLLARMPAALRAQVGLAVLLSPGTYANWEIHWGDWLHDYRHASARPVLPEVAKYQGVRSLCVYGVDEIKDSLCPTLPKGAAEVIQLPGGHHFDENYTKLADMIIARIP
ncbi:bacterial virulence protein (VirJ) [mine drainage metagenome]|uniref:Bacterial virulence protein (VirJ) n=1 Tax=mine drainage metagenome TaxID=410659 RepID=A0A1J5R4K7_9ZZZZ